MNNNTIEKENSKYISGRISKVESHIYKKNDPWYPYMISAYYKKSQYNSKIISNINILLNKKNIKSITEYDFKIEGRNELYVFLSPNDNYAESFITGNFIAIKANQDDYFHTVESVDFNS